MKHFFISGSSSGLGKALAEQCLAGGHRVTGLSRHSTISHPEYRHIAIDLGRQENLLDFRFSSDNCAGCTGVVLMNNAGMVEPVRYLGNADNEDIIRIFTLNLIAPAVLSNAFMRAFEDFKGEKSIINISSGAGKSPVDGWSFYCSTKAGMDMLTRVGAMEQEKKKGGFSIVSIAPGIVDTPMQDTIREADQKNFSRLADFKAYKQENMLASPEEAAGNILASLKNLKNRTDVVFSVK